MISAKIIQHSDNYLNKELVTFVLEYPRYIHAELLTHRVFSKNSASSRAIGLASMVEKIKSNPVEPIWTLNQKGMQGQLATELINDSADEIWKFAFEDSLKHASELVDKGIHKQNFNRLLEPWLNIRIILTGTEFSNFFELRDHKDAQPEIRELAQKMRDEYENSNPQFLYPGQWHIPFGDNIPDISPEERLKISVARCARVSYFNFEGNDDIEADYKLFDKLLSSKPLHASPAEHQAKVPYPSELQEMGVYYEKGDGAKHSAPYKVKTGKYFSNLVGWVQLRKIIESNEFKSDLLLSHETY